MVLFTTLIMNIALQFRPINVRLYVAYMADAYHGGFTKCDTGNTFTRAMQHIESGDATDYHNMWDRINVFYNTKRLYEMSDDEIIDMFNTCRAIGMDGFGTSKRTSMDLMDAKRRWDEYGWTRYERKRNGRRTIARMSIVPVMACFGIVLPSN